MGMHFMTGISKGKYRNSLPIYSLLFRIVGQR
jgi:hypothetical protein